MNASRKVLVVDDDPAVRKSIDRVLTGKGYAVITAENGEEALRKLNEEKYDLVYTDIRMPGISGLEVAEQVKARKPWTPVVIITGYGTDAAQARAKAAGVSSFVHKPLSPEMIEDSARDALAAPVAQVLALPAVAAAPEAEPVGNASVLKNILLFFAAPFIGLAYIIALPIVGLGAIAVLAVRAAAKYDSGQDCPRDPEEHRDGVRRAGLRTGLRRALPLHRVGDLAVAGGQSRDGADQKLSA